MSTSSPAALVVLEPSGALLEQSERYQIAVALRLARRPVPVASHCDILIWRLSQRKAHHGSDAIV